MSEATDHFTQADNRAKQTQAGLTSNESFTQAYEQEGIEGVIEKPLNLSQFLFTVSLLAMPEATLGGAAGGWLLRNAVKLAAPEHTTAQEVADFVGNVIGGVGAAGQIEHVYSILQDMPTKPLSLEELDTVVGYLPAQVRRPLLNTISGIASSGATDEQILQQVQQEITKITGELTPKRIGQLAFESPATRRKMIDAAQEAGTRAQNIQKKILDAQNAEALKSKANLYERLKFQLKHPQIALINAQLANPRISKAKAVTDAMNAQVQTAFRAIGVGMKYGRKAGINTLIASGRGQIEALKDGLKYLVLSIKTGEPEFQKSLGFLEKTESFGLDMYPDSPYTKAYRYLGALYGLGRRSITAIDQFSKTLDFRAAGWMFSYQEGLEEANRLGLNNLYSIDHFATQYAAKQMADMSDALYKKVIDYMNYATFTDTGAISRDLSKAANDHLLVRLLMPYTRTPVNLIAEGSYLSPLAPITQTFRDDITNADEVQRNIAQAKWLLGSLMWGVVGHEVSRGNLVGHGPMGPTREYWPLRHRPNSWRIGDLAYGFEHLGPFGSTLSYAADAWDMYFHAAPDTTVQTRIAEAGVHLMGEMIENSDYMETVANIIHASDGLARGNTKAAQEFLGREVTGFLPAPIRIADHVLTPGEHQAQTQLDEIKQNVPYWSNSIPPKRDQWGQVVYPPTATNGNELLSKPMRLFNELSPVPIYSNMQIDPVEAEHYRLGMYDRSVPNYIWKRGTDSVSLTPQQQDEWAQLRGNGTRDGDGNSLHDALQTTINDPNYQIMDDFSRRRQLDKVHQQFHHASRLEMLQNHPDLNAQVDVQSELATQRQADPVEIDPQWMSNVLRQSGDLPSGTR